jgi:hypothetical protein
MSKIKIQTELRKQTQKKSAISGCQKISRIQYKKTKPNYFKIWEGTSWGYYRSL